MSQDSERPAKRLSLSGSRLTLGAASPEQMKAGRRQVQIEVRRKRAPAAPHRSVGPTPLNSEQSPDGLSNEERVQRIRALQEGMKKPVDTPAPKKKDPVPWTVDSHKKHPDTRMWHDRVGWDNPRSESRFRMGEGITRKELEENKKIPARESKTVQEVLDLIPNLRKVSNSTRLNADLNRLFDRARYDTWSKHVYSVGVVSNRPIYPEKWVMHMRPVGAKVLLRFLIHVGPEFYIQGDEKGEFDLRALREYASSADIIEEPPARKEPAASNDNKVTPVKIIESRQQVVTTRPYDTGKLRKQMLAKHPVCPVTGIDRPEFLRVSHIKADSACELDFQKTDEANVLMLSLAADELFDGICPRGFNGWKGRAAWITFADDGKLMRSLHMTGDELRRFGISHHVSIAHLLLGKTGERRREYLKWHRENMFLDNIRKEETDG